MTGTEEKVYIRFSVLHRLVHLMIMFGFIGLALTGFSLKFSHQWWAGSLIGLLGGAKAAGLWHRFWAIVTYAGVMIHMVWFMYFKLVLKGNLTGPASIFPRWQDARDLGQHVRYFFGNPDQPRFHRFTYWEKADYWALFIGMNTMGLTGLFLWFPEWFSLFVPGWFINLAGVLHLWEAILAVSIKFVVHLVTTHFRPGIWPMEESIFTGRTTATRIKHEHPAEWDSLSDGDQ